MINSDTGELSIDSPKIHPSKNPKKGVYYNHKMTMERYSSLKRIFFRKLYRCGRILFEIIPSFKKPVSGLFTGCY